jgi:hypothetical protein
MAHDDQEVSMQRDSDRHGARVDDELDRELQGVMQGNRTSRAEEWRDQELTAEDEPGLAEGDLTNARTETGPVDTGTIEASPADVAEQRMPADPDSVVTDDDRT